MTTPTLQEDPSLEEEQAPPPPPPPPEAEAPSESSEENDEEELKGVAEGSPPLPVPVPLGGVGGRLMDDMPESIRNAPPPAAPPDFSAYRRAAAAPPKEDAMEPETYPEDYGEEEEDHLDLASWLRQRTYAPGLSYVSIRRLSPVNFRGYTTGGMLEEVHDAFDAAWIGQRWGGGTYALEIYEWDDRRGRAYRADSRTVQLGGVPTHYRGPSGEPVALPGGAPPQATYNGPPPAWSSFPTGRPFMAGNAQQRPQYDDVSNRRREDVQVMGMVRDTVEKSAAAQTAVLQSQNEAVQRELDRARRDQREAEERRRMDSHNLITPVNAAVESVKTQLVEQGATFQRHLSEQRQSFDMELRSSRESQERQLDMARQQTGEQLRSKDEAHARYLEDLRDRHRHEVDGVREQLRRAEDRTRDENARTEQMLAARYESQVKAGEVENRRLRDEIERIRGEARTAEEQVRSELEKLRTEKGKGLSANLTEFAGVMTAMTSVAEGMGFNKASASSEAVPADTLGKILHYAPSIGEHVVSPIAKRVDNLAEAIREQKSVVQAQQVAQQHLNTPQPALPVGMPMPGAAPYYLPPQAVAGGPEEVAPAPAAAPPPPPPPPPPPSDPAPAKEEAGPAPLIEFLVSRLEDDAPVALVGQEIKGAISAAELENIVQAPAEVLVAQIAQAAGGSSPLSTPRGEAWLKELHATLKGT